MRGWIRAPVPGKDRFSAPFEGCAATPVAEAEAPLEGGEELSTGMRVARFTPDRSSGSVLRSAPWRRSGVASDVAVAWMPVPAVVAIDAGTYAVTALVA